MHDAFIPAVRRNDADIDTAFCRGAKCRDHAVIDDEIGGHDIHVLSCFGDHLRIYMIGNVFIVQRRICKGDHKAIIFLDGAGHILPRVKGIVVIFDLDVRLPCLGGNELPSFQKHQCEAPSGISFDANAGILPMTKGAFDIDVFICDIQTACISDLAVDDEDLFVITIILDGVQNRNEAIERGTMNPFRFHFFGEIQGETKKTAHVIIKDADLDALLGFFLQDAVDGIPHFSVLDDKGFDKNIGLRFFKIGKKCFPKILARGKMLRRCIFEDGKTGMLFQIFDLTCMGGCLLCGFFVYGRGERVGGLCLLRKRFNCADQLFGAGLISEQQIKNAAEDGEYQNDEDPRQLVGFLGALGDDMQGDEQADDFQQIADDGGHGALVDQII